MKIGIHFNSRHLGEWSWQSVAARQLPLSGTDALSLFLAQRLGSSGIDLRLYSARIGEGLSPCPQSVAESLEVAVEAARSDGRELLIFNSTGGEETIAGLKACRRVHQRCVVVDHNGPAPAIGDVLAACPEVLRVVCVSRAQADCIRDQRVFAKVEVIGNPLLASSGPAADPREELSVAFLGALTPSKGFHHLAAAWPSVRRVLPQARLYVIGSARLYEREQELGPLGIAEERYERALIVPHLGSSALEAASRGVTFLGLLSPGEVEARLRRVSVCVVNPNCRTSQETFCVSAIEASACGAAVIGARYGGLTETVLHGRTGMLIRKERELAGAVVELLRQPIHARQLGQNGRDHVGRSYAPERIVDEWRRLIERSLAGQPAVPPPFWPHSGLRTYARQAVRLARTLPGLGALPSLRGMRAALRRSGRK
jgi:glycosyltransferase involved in cell wall biosynthesis